MKETSKKNIIRYCISSQIDNRPTKNAKGMCYTNERRARQTNNSFLYAGFVDKSKYKQSDESRTLSVKGTLDKLVSLNKLKIAKIKNFRQKNKLNLI